MSNLTKTNIRVTINSEDNQKRAIEILEKHGERILEKHNAMEFSEIGIHLICRKKEHDWLVCYIERSNLWHYSEITLDQLDELLAKQEKEIMPKEIIPEIEEEFCNYQQSLRLKKLGFDRPCFGFYLYNDKVDLFKDCKWEERTNSFFINHFLDKNISCVSPTFSQAFRWFRDNHNLFHSIDRIFEDEFGYTITPMDKEPEYKFGFDNWDNAESTCLDKLLEIVESRIK